MKEIWKDIEGYEGIYQVSNLGNVKSNNKILKGREKENNYLQVSLYKDGNKNTQYIHRLVAEAFIENPENKEFVNHKNFNKKDNSVNNLEWVTRKENFEHFHKSEKYLQSQEHKNKTLTHKTLQKVKEYKNIIITMHKNNKSIKEIAKELKISKEFISDVLYLFDIY